MKDKDITYKKILDKLQNLSPELENQEELTQIVNAKIKRLSANKNKIRIIRIMGIVSGAAAILMFFLLIAENNRQTFPSEQISTVQVVTRPKINRIQTQNTLEKISSIVRQKQQRKQLKEMIYINLTSNKISDYGHK